MPTNSEATINVELGRLLRTRHPDWRSGVGVEQSQVLRRASHRPDIVVRSAGGQVVVVETEFSPGRDVERDARARLGRVVEANDEPVEQTVALLLPEALKEGQEDLAERVAAADLRFAVFAGTEEAPDRWPAKGWLSGGVDDLAACVEFASLSERRIAAGAEALETGVRQAAFRLRELSAYRKSDSLEGIARVLRQEESEQTTRMAMAILANAVAFHHSIAGTHGIPQLIELHLSVPGLDRTKLLYCWRDILERINYWPIFKIASDVLRAIAGVEAEPVLDRLEKLAAELAKTGATATHDLSGQMFQRLIVDRKFLATFYTLPASAALLAELAVPRLETDWGDGEALARLRIADLACGTGTLLNAAYQAVRMRHRHRGGDDAELHPAMMERALIAADIMPAATHLTASILSSAHPAVPFEGTRIVTMPYGEQPSETGHPLSIGSLDLLADETARSVVGVRPGVQMDAFGTARTQVRGTGGEAEDDAHAVNLPHEDCDLVIMNPPFTRPTNHESATIPVPSFAGFDTSDDEQRAMSAMLKRLRERLDAPAGDGNAGLASYFVDLADMKTKPGGVLALVLPAAFVQGGSWTAARTLLGRRYEDLTVVSIAASGNTERAFSADTGMAEALVLGTKKRDRDAPCRDTLFVNLLRRPRSRAEAAALAGAVERLPDEPRSGRILVGEDDVGTFVRAPLAEGGCAALREPTLADAMLALRDGELALPRTNERPSLPTTALDELGTRGKVDRDIAGRNADGTPRGPFDVVAPRDQPLYPVLWRHAAARERNLVVEPDREGVVREGLRARANDLWQTTASRLHFSRDFQINSQSLAACLTPEKSIGGRAWPNFVARREEWEAPLALWANSTLGLMSFWWAGTRQQQGRAMLTISRLPSLTVLDPRRLSARRLKAARLVFDKFQDRDLLPANEAYRDEVRQALDRALFADVLGLPETLLKPLDALRRSWCAEPTVHGGKETRP